MGPSSLIHPPHLASTEDHSKQRTHRAEARPRPRARPRARTHTQANPQVQEGRPRARPRARTHTQGNPQVQGGRPRARPRARTHTQANPQVQGRSGRPKNVANGQDLNDVGTLQASKPLRLAPSNLTNHCKGSTMENTNSPNRRSCRIKLGAQTQARPSQSTPIAAGDLKWQSYIRSLLGNGIVLRG